MEHPIQCDCPKNNERMWTMLNEIVTKEEMKFKDLEGKIFKFVNMLGCLIIKSILEKRDAQIKQTRDKGKYRNKGARANTIKTIMGEVEYYRTRYLINEDGVSKYTYLLDEQMDINTIGKISQNFVEALLEIVPKTDSYRKAEEVLKTTTGAVLSFEAIRTVVLEVGKKITAKEKEEIELNKKGQLIAGDKDVVALFEEADGIFINLQGKDRQEALEEQKKTKGEDEQTLKRKKVKKELKLHVMYEGWKEGDSRHSLVNKKYIAGMMKAKEIANLRDARVHRTYKEEGIKLRVLNGDGASWTKGITPKNGIYQKDLFHIMKAIKENVSEEYQGRIRNLITTKRYDEIYDNLQQLKYEEGGEENAVKKLERLQAYLMEGLERYSDLVEVPEAPKGLEFRALGTQESHIFSKLEKRFCSGRKAFSIEGANALAKICVLSKKISIDDIEAPLPIDTSIDDWIKELEENAKRNKKACRKEFVGKGDMGAKQSHSEFKFMKEIFKIKGFSGLRLSY